GDERARRDALGAGRPRGLASALGRRSRRGIAPVAAPCGGGPAPRASLARAGRPGPHHSRRGAPFLDAAAPARRRGGPHPGGAPGQARDAPVPARRSDAEGGARASRSAFATLYYAYVLDKEQRLLGVVSFRELIAAPKEARVSDTMERNVVTVTEDMGQEKVSQLFSRSGLLAIPVVDAEKRVKGIVTIDDIVQVVNEVATEDIQKIGGSEALGEPYLNIAFGRMLKKRAGWLSALFLGEMLTATAMGFFEKEIDRAVVLALFVPLIISSGGNSGSQATSLVIRAMALGELRLRDWFRVIRRELASGAALGSILGTIGFLRIEIWQHAFHTYGEHHVLVALTVFASLIGVVTFGTLAGSLLPFVLRRLGFDPASASAPFVATLVDVTGLIIYFTTASAILRGTLL
ncbi:MAG: magnesium transporter, partial [Deltaproteobacteria bacterium]